METTKQNSHSKKPLFELARSIKKYGHTLGFQDVRISGIDPAQHAKYLQQWLAHDYHGEMHYMAKHGEKRAYPEQLLPGSTRVISCRMDYLPNLAEQEQTIGANALAILNNPIKGYISRYALGRDYHKLVRKRLAKIATELEQYSAEHNHRGFIDSAPILERAFAEQAGLGWIGKNTLLINAKAGSWFFLGEILTDVALPIDPPQQVSHCGSCQACLDICPTKAFKGPWQLDARRCISYLTIELNSSIPVELRPLMGNRIFGCDDCQLVCPWNKFAKASKETDFSPRHQLDSQNLLDLFKWPEDEFLHKTQGSAIRRIGYYRWLRNIAVALGNAPFDEAIINELQKKQHYESELVREHVFWALQQQLAKRLPANNGLNAN